MQRSPYESITVEESFLRGDFFPGRSYERTTASAVRQQPPLEPPTIEASLSRAQQRSNASKSPYNQRRRIIGPPIRLSPYESQTIEESLLNAQKSSYNRNEAAIRPIPTSFRGFPYESFTIEESLVNPTLS
ncbi:hypothetical protein CIHG_00929 [Coccidioides immitis H538.4]|uniref:Uncharacterized protein n=1 Tax=Coccidioides immitis H538.4 TaxID=396776 RepID=A0A0J8RDZ3_COCIT|nr:hypothetical protein CIHG_00929 [Coccidioides immitis H538.4]